MRELTSQFQVFQQGKSSETYAHMFTVTREGDTLMVLLGVLQCNHHTTKKLTLATVSRTFVHD